MVLQLRLAIIIDVVLRVNCVALSIENKRILMMRDMRQLAASGFQPQVRCIIDTPERLVGGRLIALRIVSNLVVVNILIS